MNKKLSILFGVFLFFVASATALPGSGTESDPYLVNSDDDFMDVCNQHNGQGYFKQTSDIDMSAYPEYFTCNFQGSYNGQGYEIKNADPRKQGDGEGVFGNLQSEPLSGGGYTTIKNVVINGAVVGYDGSGQQVGLFAGGIASTLSPGLSNKINIKNVSIINSNISAKTNSAYEVGGLIGYPSYGASGVELEVKNVFVINNYFSGENSIGSLIGKDDVASRTFENVWAFGNEPVNGASLPSGHNGIALFGADYPADQTIFENTFNVDAELSVTQSDPTTSGHPYNFTATEVRDGSYISQMGETESSWFGDNPIYQRSIPLTGYEEPATDGMPSIEGFDKNAPVVTGTSFKNLDRGDYEGNDYLVGDTIRMSATFEEQGDFQYGLGVIQNNDMGAIPDDAYENLSTSNNLDSPAQQSVTLNITFDAKSEDYEQFVHDTNVSESNLHLLFEPYYRGESNQFIEGEVFDGEFNFDEDLIGTDKVAYYRDGSTKWEDDITWTGQGDDETELMEVIIFESGTEVATINGTPTEIFNNDWSEFENYDFGTGNRNLESIIKFCEVPSVSNEEECFTVEERHDFEVFDTSDGDFSVENITFESRDYGVDKVKFIEDRPDSNNTLSDEILIDYDVSFSKDAEIKESELLKQYYIKKENGFKLFSKASAKDGEIVINEDKSVDINFTNINQIGEINWFNKNTQTVDTDFDSDIRMEFHEIGGGIVASKTVTPVYSANQTIRMNQFTEKLEPETNYELVLKELTTQGDVITLGNKTVNISETPPEYENLGEGFEGKEVLTLIKCADDIFTKECLRDWQDIYTLYENGTETDYEEYLTSFKPNTDFVHDFAFYPVFRSQYGADTIIEDAGFENELITIDNRIEYDFDYNVNPATNQVTVSFEEIETLSSISVTLKNDINITQEEIFLTDFTKENGVYKYSFENVSSGNYIIDYTVDDSIGNSEEESYDILMPQSDRWSQLKGWISEYSGYGFHTIGFVMTIFATMVVMLFTHLITGNKGKGFGSEKLTLMAGGVALTFCFMTGILSGSNYAGTLAVVLSAIASFEFGSW